MKTVIAEKPSVARTIAIFLGATEQKEGYLTGNGYYVTWAYGHLVGLALPETYGFKGFDPSVLPILPNPFELNIRTIKTNQGYTTDRTAWKQLQIIKELFTKSTSIIVATDAGREGELIFRYIYEYLKCNKPFQRLWISSLTEKAMKQGFENLKNGNEFNGLYEAAQARSRADWLVGINASQALSITVEKDTYSLGRVQTPTLALLCKRYLEHIHFVSEKYWEIELKHIKSFVTFKSQSQKKWSDKTEVEEALNSIQRKENDAIVHSVTTKTVTEQPPLLFDLTGLQKEANKKLNLSAEETLNIAQSLYEKQFITYPRTGSKYIPEDVWEEIPRLVTALKDCTSCNKAVLQLKWSRMNKRIVNDLRVTDHHGLLTTEKVPSSLHAKEQAIYDLIALRLLEALSESCIKEITTADLQLMHYDFEIKACKIVTPGWRSIKGIISEDSNDPIQELPLLKKGDTLQVEKATVLEKETQPPRLYTEAGLLEAMEQAAKTITNEEERDALQAIGIGTPGTRAAIIETLFTRNYIQRDKKSLVPTSKGLQVYDLMKGKKIADVAMTAEWEINLLQIENNISNAASFQKEIEHYTKTITEELLAISITKESVPKLTCPKCKKRQLKIRDLLVKCTDETCNWVQFRMICQVHLSISDIQNLIDTGKSPLIRGMKSKKGKKFDAYIVLNHDCTTSFFFENNKQ